MDPIFGKIKTGLQDEYGESEEANAKDGSTPLRYGSDTSSRSAGRRKSDDHCRSAVEATVRRWIPNP